jgi:tetraacyldisaccharide 4'-kinase
MAVSPVSWLYRVIMAVRNTAYDSGLLRIHDSVIPVVSIGNVTVGGTGKTPFSAYVVSQLLASGHRPAVVMRGYGDDERYLHGRMNPGVLVITGADRVKGILAAATAGADVAVLDDGFQHRRARRDLDIVLVSAERWSADLGLLPAGPLREPLSSLRRADLVIVTQKSADDGTAGSVLQAIRSYPDVSAGLAIAKLEPSELVAVNGPEKIPLGAVKGERVLAVAGIGDPASFFAQLGQLGAEVTERRFRDHHPYSANDAAVLAAESAAHKYVITTEKDAVKLARVWPANGPELWYLSQAVRLTEGLPLVAAALAKLFLRATSIA